MKDSSKSQGIHRFVLNAAHPPGESESQRSLLDNLRTEMQDQSIQPTPVASPLVPGLVGIREDRIPDSLKKVELAWRHILRGHYVVFRKFVPIPT